jgi:predicted sugar kinase
LSTDGRRDGHGETSIPPYNFVAGGIIVESGIKHHNPNSNPTLYCCRVLLDDVITCVVSDIHTQYNKTCTEKEQHNIVVNNKDTIEAVVNVNPVLCKLYSKTI